MITSEFEDLWSEKVCPSPPITRSPKRIFADSIFMANSLVPMLQSNRTHQSPFYHLQFSSHLRKVLIEAISHHLRNLLFLVEELICSEPQFVCRPVCLRVSVSVVLFIHVILIKISVYVYVYICMYISMIIYIYIHIKSHKLHTWSWKHDFMI